MNRASGPPGVSIKEVVMATRLMFIALLCAASLGWAGSPERPARAARAADPAVVEVVTNSESAWRKPRPGADETAPRPRTGAPVRPAGDPTVKQDRASDRGSVETEPEITTAPARVRFDPAADELSVRSPGPAAGFELVPDEAETRCMRTEGQMRCTPLYK
jgi:hypothetical protein